jgi:hypothetical protein
MLKSMMQICTMTTTLVFGLGAIAPPALANEGCGCWRHHHHHVVSSWRHPHWAYRGWGPGVGFGALTGVTDDHLALYNHPYYYGGGPYGNCTGYRLVVDEWGVASEQSVYIC